MPAKKILLDWIAKDDLQKVFQNLFFLANKYKDEQLRSDITFQSGRFNALEKQRLNSTISQEEEYLQTAKIRQALLHIVQGLPDKWILEGIGYSRFSDAAPSDVNWKKYATYFAMAIILIMGIIGFSGHSFKDFFKPEKVTEQPATILPPLQKATTSGPNSPAIITRDGDVNMSFGDTKPKNDSTRTEQNPQK